MFEYKFISLANISSIRKEWELLEDGEELTYFQSFAWYDMLSSLNSHIVDSRFDVGFGIVSENDKIILIAPLWIVKKTFGKFNKKGVYIFGRGQWSDYLNFIYNKWIPEAVDFLFDNIVRNYKVSDFYFENLKCDCSLAKYIEQNFKINSCVSGVCVNLFLPDSFEEYTSSLSKNTRQNIRTAHNRAKKDGIEFVCNFDDTAIDLNDFAVFRDVRVSKKNKWSGMNLKWRVLNFISTKILKRGWYRFAEYTPFYNDVNSKFITIKTKNGELCSAFNYGIDRNRKEIVLMAVSTNEKFARYSPGVILIYEFILKLIDEKKIRILDFTRGNERYKYALGGREQQIVSLEFTI